MPNHGRVAIVTGAAQGIGYGISERLARDGYYLVGTDRNGLTMADAVKRLAAAGLTIRGEPLDVRDRKGAEALVDSLPRVDVLVNNAGIFKDAEFTDLTERDFAEVYEVNVTGAAIMAQEALRKMQAGARIINIASRAFLGARRHAHYAASKAGVIAFVKSLAAELAPDNVLVNAIAPGATDTAMSRSGSTEEEWKKREAVPPLMGGLTTKEEIVGLVRYLLSEPAKHITGQTFFLRTPK